MSDKVKTIVPHYIVDLGDRIYCNELRFIVDGFLEANPEYKKKVKELRELKNKRLNKEQHGKRYKQRNLQQDSKQWIII